MHETSECDSKSVAVVIDTAWADDLLAGLRWRIRDLAAKSVCAADSADG